jgi:hypothetical protein
MAIVLKVPAAPDPVSEAVAALAEAASTSREPYTPVHLAALVRSASLDTILAESGGGTGLSGRAKFDAASAAKAVAGYRGAALKGSGVSRPELKAKVAADIKSNMVALGQMVKGENKWMTHLPLIVCCLLALGAVSMLTAGHFGWTIGLGVTAIGGRVEEKKKIEYAQVGAGALELAKENKLVLSPEAKQIKEHIEVLKEILKNTPNPKS